MGYVVDFKDVSNVGLESSPFANQLAGLRANEARYFKNKYDVDFTTEPASKAKNLVEYVAKVLRERDIVIAAKPLEATEMIVDGTVRWTYVFFESGLAINVLYDTEPGGKRAVGFKLCMDMPIPEELATKFKFARQKSKLAGEIRGTFFVVKGEY